MRTRGGDGFYGGGRGACKDTLFSETRVYKRNDPRHTTSITRGTRTGRDDGRDAEGGNATTRFYLV